MPDPIPVNVRGGRPPVSLAVEGAPPGIVLEDNGDRTGQLVGTITGGADSPYTTTIVATDALGKQARDSFIWTVASPFVPGTPVVVGSYTTAGVVSPSYANVAQLDADRVFVAAGGIDRVFVADITNPAAPVEAWSSTEGSPNDPDVIARFGDYVLVTTTGNDTLYLYDVSTPAAPVLVDTLALGTCYAATFLDATHLAVRGFLGSHWLRVYAWSPAGFGALTGTVTPSAGDVRDMHANPSGTAVAWAQRNDDRVHLANVTDRAAPVASGNLTHVDLDECRNVRWLNDRYVLATGYNNRGLNVIDAANLAAPTRVGYLATGSNPTGVAVIDARYVIVVGSGFLRVVDVSTPSAPTQAAVVFDATLNGAKAVAFDGTRYATVYTGARVVAVVDLKG